jgi:hypothetical protein
MTRRVLVVLCLLLGVAHADPDPRRKIIVIEYRSGSTALPNIAGRLVDMIGQKTSLRVLGLDQTRVEYGAHLDQVIVKCQGDPVCVARIGQKVGAIEVLLVAVSELGDVLLTVQRIDVASHSVVSRMAETMAAGGGPTDEQLEGYLARLLPPGDFLRYGMIDIVANIAGAGVTISGEKRGVTPMKEPLKLKAPATYNIRIEKDGYVPYVTKVELPPDGRIKVEAELGKRGSTAWYAHWYVLVPAAAIVAGAAGTSIYFATRPGGFSGDGKLPVTGTIN